MKMGSSDACASGRMSAEDSLKKPAEEVKVTVRPASTSEVMDILRRFPGMVPDYLSSQNNDTGLLKYLFPFKEVTSAPVERVFPGVRFYQGIDRSRSCGAEYPYMIAIAGHKRYWMPGEFNRLLFDNGLLVTEGNMAELGKVLFILAVGSGGTLPEIAFLDGAKIKEIKGGVSYDVRLKVKVNEQEEEWCLTTLYGHFSGASRRNTKDLIMDYWLNSVESP